MFVLMAGCFQKCPATSTNEMLDSSFTKGCVMQILREVPDLAVATQITAEGFSQKVSPTLQKDVQEHLRGGQLIYRVVDDGNDVGFGIFKVLNANILYVSGAILRSKYQGKGLFGKLVGQARIDEPDVLYLALRTQSCSCWIAGMKLCKNWFLHWDGNKMPFDHVMMKRHVVADYLHCDIFSRRHYEGSLYGKKPVHHDEQFQQWWDRMIPPCEEGGGEICIGTLKK